MRSPLNPRSVNFDGPPLHVAIKITGPVARDNPSWQSTCQQVVEHYGGVWDLIEPEIKAEFYLAYLDPTSMTITANGNAVVSESVPRWTPADACTEAFARMLALFKNRDRSAVARAQGLSSGVSLPGKVIAADLEPRRGVTSNPKSLALVIAIEKYRKDLPDAVGAANDGRSISAILEKTVGLPRINIHTLIDSDATKSSIDAEIDEWLQNNASNDGDVYFYFAGHGSPDSLGKSTYLVAWDTNIKFLATQGVMVDKVVTRLSLLRTRRVFAFVDACFSGAGGRSVLAPGARSIVLATQAATIAQRSTPVHWFAAAKPDQITGAHGNNGLFSYHLMRGLNGAADSNSDGSITLGELVSYTERNVREEARLAGNRDQEPSLSGPSQGWQNVLLAKFAAP